MAETSSKKLGLAVPVEFADRLKTLSDRTMIPQSKLLRRALELLFDEYAEQLKPVTGKGT
jgi:predicted DNA-binding protein